MSRIAELYDRVDAYHEYPVAEAVDVLEVGSRIDSIHRVYGELEDVAVTLESLAFSLASTVPEEVTVGTRTFIEHSVRAVTTQLGIKTPGVGLESHQEYFTVTLEGIGSMIASVWNAILDSIKKVLKAIGDFFAKLFGFKKKGVEELKDQIKDLDKTSDKNSDVIKVMAKKSDALRKKATGEDAKAAADKSKLLLSPDQLNACKLRVASTESVATTFDKIQLGTRVFYLVPKELVERALLVDITGPARALLGHVRRRVLSFTDGPSGAIITNEHLLTSLSETKLEKSYWTSHISLEIDNMEDVLKFAERSWKDYKVPTTDQERTEQEALLTKLQMKLNDMGVIRGRGIDESIGDANRKQIQSKEAILTYTGSAYTAKTLLSSIVDLSKKDLASEMKVFSAKSAEFILRWKKLAEHVASVGGEGAELEKVIRRAASTSCIRTTHNTVNGVQKVGLLEVNMVRLGGIMGAFVIRMLK